MIEFVLNRIMNLGRKNVLLLGARKVSFHIELQNLMLNTIRGIKQ